MSCSAHSCRVVTDEGRIVTPGLLCLVHKRDVASMKPVSFWAGMSQDWMLNYPTELRHGRKLSVANSQTAPRLYYFHKQRFSNFYLALGGDFQPVREDHRSGVLRLRETDQRR